MFPAVSRPAYSPIGVKRPSPWWRRSGSPSPLMSAKPQTCVPLTQYSTAQFLGDRSKGMITKGDENAFVFLCTCMPATLNMALMLFCKLPKPTVSVRWEFLNSPGVGGQGTVVHFLLATAGAELKSTSGYPSPLISLTSHSTNVFSGLTKDTESGGPMHAPVENPAAFLTQSNWPVGPLCHCQQVLWD